MPSQQDSCRLEGAVRLGRLRVGGMRRHAAPAAAAAGESAGDGLCDEEEATEREEVSGCSKLGCWDVEQGF